MSGPLDIALSEACRLGAEDVEVSHASTTTEFTRFAHSRFTQVGESRQDLVRVRVLSRGRLGIAMCASLAPEELRGAAAQAMAIAERVPPLEVAIRFLAADMSVAASAEPSEPPGDSFEGPGELRRAFDRAAGVAFFGALKRRWRHFAVTTSGGLERAHADQVVQVDFIAQIADGSGWAGWYGASGRPLDLATLADRAADTARRAREPVSLDPGPQDVVLAPAAVAELLEWMSLASFGGRSVLDGTSLLAGREGQQLISPRLTLTEVVGAGDVPFDAEGTPRQEVEFFRDGRAGRAVTDLVSAARLADGRASTGHAAPLSPQGEATDQVASHLRLAPGDASEEDLIGRVDRGVYVTRLHYVNGLLDTRRATMTGMTRDGTFLIEDGRLGRPVRNLRFTDGILDALSESRLGGIGRDTTCVPTWWSSAGQVETPALLLRGFQFTGTSR
jgi:PmbA protein